MLMKNESIETVGPPTSSLHSKDNKSLSEFLDTRLVSNVGGLPTHVSIPSSDSHGRCYNIPYGTELYDEFIDLYTQSILKGERHSLVEQFNAMSHGYRMVVDLDFRHSDSERQYDDTLISSFIEKLNSYLFEYVKGVNSKLKVYILEKGCCPRRYKTDNCEGYKDGVHIVYPDIISKREFQSSIKDLFLFDHPDFFDGFTNLPKKIYDLPPAGFLMYGSCKPGETDYYKVTKCRIYSDPKTYIDVPYPSERFLVTALSLHQNVPMIELKKRMESSFMKKLINVRNSAEYNVTCHHQLDESIEVSSLLNLLSVERAYDENSWMEVGWLLHNLNSKEYLAVWKCFSQRHRESDDRNPKYSEQVCDERWNQMKVTCYNKGSLYYWAYNDNRYEYIKLMNSWGKHTLLDMSDLKHYGIDYDYFIVKNVFEQYVCRISEPTMFIDDTYNNQYERTRENLRSNYEYLKCYDSKKKELVQFIDRWLKDIDPKTYRMLDFLPPPLKVPEGVYNTWQGFTIDGIDVKSSKNIVPFKRHVSILSGHDDKSSNYLIKWLADMIQNPGSKKCSIAPIFLSKQGAGKNIFFNMFSEMIGEDLYYETSNPIEDLFGTYAEGFYNRLLIDIDESNFKTTSSIHERLKNAVCSERLNVNMKFSRPIKTRNFVRIFFTTNNLVSTKISEDDRRHVIFEVSNEMCGNKDYFTDFVSYMKDRSNQKAVMEYLRSIDLSGVNWIEDRPISSAYKQSQMCTNCTVLQYLEYLVFDYGIKDGYSIKGSELFQGYMDWCKSTNIQERRVISFVNPLFKKYGSETTPECIELKKSCGVSKYIFHVDGIKKVLQNHGFILVD